MVLLQGVHSPDLVAALRASATAALDAELAGLSAEEQRRGRADALAIDAGRVAVRSPGRWEIKVPVTPTMSAAAGGGVNNSSSSSSSSSSNGSNPWTRPELLLAPSVLQAILLAVDDNRLEMDTFSVVTSLPDTEGQSWHRDVSDLFKVRPLCGDYYFLAVFYSLTHSLTPRTLTYSSTCT